MMNAMPHGPRRRRRIGAWRAALAVPAIDTSLLLLVFLLGPLGGWSGLVLAGWLAAGALTLTPGGERCAVRILCRFRAPSRADRESIGSVLNVVLDRDGVDPGGVDLYVRRGRGINAYATGRRSIAVTSAVAMYYRDGKLDDAILAGVLSHEIGHMVARDTRWALATAWLAAPWRSAYRLGARLAAPLARHQPPALLSLVITTGTVVASYQAAEQNHWATAVALCALAVCAVVVPLSDARLSRASEYAADAHAVRAGYRDGLVAALWRAEQSGAVARPRILQHHPSTRRRLGRMGQSVARAKVPT